MSHHRTTIPVAARPMPYLPESDYSGCAGRLLAAPSAHAPTDRQRRPTREGRSPEAVAKGFEEIFASILFKQMRQTIGEDGMFGHDPGDVLGGMFDHFKRPSPRRAAGHRQDDSETPGKSEPSAMNEALTALCLDHLRDKEGMLAGSRPGHRQ